MGRPKTRDYTDILKTKRQEELVRKKLHPEKYLLIKARQRAKEKGLAFNIDISDIVVPTNCPVLNIPLCSQSGKRGACPNSPSLDRIQPSLGYVKGNVMVISYRANSLKNNATLEELEAILKYVRSYQKDKQA